MDPKSLQFLEDLLSAPGPSGFEGPVQQVVREYAASFSDEIRTDLHGNVILCADSQQPHRVMLAGHCDQIGMLITYIDENGYLYAQTIGGWDAQQLIGQRMSIWTQSGPIAAVIARKPIHLLTSDERKQVVKEKELWLDIGANCREDAEEVVRVGDPVTLQLGLQKLRNNLANAPAMDNRTGLWVIVEAFRRTRDLGGDWAVFAVSTVQEEIGLRGARTSAFSIDPQLGLAVDVTHATDCPTVEPNQLGEIKLGGGPVIYRGPNMNLRLTDHLIETAQSEPIPYQLAAIGRATPNDANSLQISRQGVATGLVSVPNRYMHSAVETISLEDVDHAADLLAKAIASLEEPDAYRP